MGNETGLPPCKADSVPLSTIRPPDSVGMHLRHGGPREEKGLIKIDVHIPAPVRCRHVFPVAAEIQRARQVNQPIGPRLVQELVDK